MIHNTRYGRAFSLALMIAIALASASLSFAADTSPSLVGTVNVNTATSEELQLLPGIGEARAGAVIALRKSRGGFKSVNELADVKGIGDIAMERLRPFIRLQGKTTARIE